MSLFMVVETLAVGPQPQEFEQRNRWIAPLLDQPQPTPRPHMEILYQDATDGISRGKSWRGTPYQLGDKTYTNGVAFNSTKHLLDRPGPARGAIHSGGRTGEQRRVLSKARRTAMDR